MEQYIIIFTFMVIAFMIGYFIAVLTIKYDANEGGDLIVDMSEGYKQLYLNVSYDQLDKIDEDGYIKLRVIRRKN